MSAFFGGWMVALGLCLAAGPGPAESQAALGPQLITNLAQLTLASPTNSPSRRRVRVDLSGVVVIGGGACGIVALDGSRILLPFPASAPDPLRRGERIRIQGQSLIDGTNLLLDARPLIENDGLHAMYERSAGLWLEAGRAPIRVRYFNRTGERGLALRIAGPALPLQLIPDGMLCHAETNPMTSGISWKRGLEFKCYDGGWSALPNFESLNAAATGGASNFDIGVADRQDNFGLVFEGCLEVPRNGFYNISCTSDDGSMVDLGEGGMLIKRLGVSALPALPRLAAGQLVGHDEDSFCAALEGAVTFAVQGEGGLRLELSSGRGKADVRLSPDIGLDAQWMVGARVLAAGICQTVFTAEGSKVAGQLSVYGEGNLQVLDLPNTLWNAQPLLTVREVSAILFTNQHPRLVRLAGVLKPGIGGVEIRDETGAIVLRAADVWSFGPGSPVEALGLAAVRNANPDLRCFALRRIAPVRGQTHGLPLLTTVQEVKQMSRDEAKRGYPVRVRGVITFVWPQAGFFLQDATWSIDVRLATNALTTEPQIGEYWQVEGETFAEFAPDILATRANCLGPGIMPDPERPTGTQLVDGSMDTQYIEVQGVVLPATGTALNLLTRSGRITAQLPETSPELLARFRGTLVRVRGCVIPGRDIKTQQVKLGEFELRNASVAVDEPAPANLFALPLKHATDLLLFDSHASPIERARIGGVVLHEREDVIFLMDGSNGVRVVSEIPSEVHPGDTIEAVGFPDLTGPSPAFNNAVVRWLGHGPLPAPVTLPADHVLDGRYDATRVAIAGTLISQWLSRGDQVLEMRSGTRPWLARLPLRTLVLPELPWGSELKLTGVYAGQGGDRMHGREIDSFELLLGSARDVAVLRSPSWWTVRRAVTATCGLLGVLLLAFIWIWALHRQVDERTHELKNEIEDHKRTEIELEQKTRLLTREIDERRRIEAEVERGHRQLLVTSRLAGMAEVATSVLHNVGNVMTSVNVLSASIVDLVRHSKVSSVARLGELLGKNRNAMDHFVAQDERGRRLPDYVEQLGSHLADEQGLLLQKVRVLNENIQHINDIVGRQQGYAKASGLMETLAPEEVVEDALQMHGESLKRHGINLVRDFGQIPAMTMDRHKVLQILFNLLENAKYACLQGGVADKKITVRLQLAPDGFVRLAVLDNGMGIPPENLSRIFGQGFSTRKDGHGFGLHSSALAAQDMGGRLAVHSEGPDQGATFVLEIPLKPASAAPSQN
ncbi:MAG: ATP-binding protein [Verrucomicrobiota bacterium]